MIPPLTLAHNLLERMHRYLAAHPEISADARKILTDVVEDVLKDIVARIPTRGAAPAPQAIEAAAAGPRIIQDALSDSKLPAHKIFSPELVTITDKQRESAHRRRASVPTKHVQKAWMACPWHKLGMLPIIGPTVEVIYMEDLKAILPHMGIDRIAYSAADQWVCRAFAITWCGILISNTGANCGFICDTSGEHMYCAIPVQDSYEEGYDAPGVHIVVVEPQVDMTVARLNPKHHYTGQAGFAVLL